MTCNVRDLSEENLKQKIENIKAECEKKVVALKRYEEELERRKQEVPFGVPLGEGRMFGNIQQSLEKIYTTITLEEVFESVKSSDLFFERLKTWRHEYSSNARGEPIDIEFLLPLLKKGLVAMDKNKRWFWYKYTPTKAVSFWKIADVNDFFCLSGAFNIKPVENWEYSLMECGL